MGTKVFGFIYNTLRAQANNPENKEYWLPTVLAGIDKPEGGGKLLPLVGKEWDLGEVRGEGGAIFQKVMKDQWWFLVDYQMKKKGRGAETKDHQAIPCPSAPWPRFSLPSVTVFGLDNVLLLDNPLTTVPATGYSTVMTLQFGYYRGGKVPALSELRLEGGYSVEQCVCSGKATSTGEPLPTVCDDWVPAEKIHGIGTFAAVLTDVFVDVEVDVGVDGSGPQRALQLDVRKVTMRGGSEPLPQVKVPKLTVESSLNPALKNLWLQKANDALTSNQGRAGMVGNLNANLNQPATRQMLSQMLTRQLGRLIDDNLGAAPADLATGSDAGNPADQLLLDRVRGALNTPSSPYFLPAIVCANASPVLEPLTIERVPVPDQTVGFIPFQNIALTGVVVAGLSNVIAPPDQVQVRGAQDGLNATLRLSALASPPAVLTSRGSVQVPPRPMMITGAFSCNVPDVDEPITGTISLRVFSSNVYAEMLIAGSDADTLAITFTNALELRADPNEVAVTLQAEGAFLDIINQLFNQPDIKNQALQAINAKIREHVSDLSREATAGARKMIKAKMHA